MVQPWLPIADPDANIDEYTVAALSAIVEAFVFMSSIIDVGIPKYYSRPSMGIMKLVAKGLKSLAIVGLGVIGRLCVIDGENTTSSCTVDNIAFMLDMERFLSVEFATTMPSPILLDGCYPLLLFLGFTILLTYLLIGLLTSFLVILPLLNLMHAHKFEKFHK